MTEQLQKLTTSYAALANVLSHKLTTQGPRELTTLVGKMRDVRQEIYAIDPIGAKQRQEAIRKRAKEARVLFEKGKLSAVELQEINLEAWRTP